MTSRMGELLLLLLLLIQEYSQVTAISHSSGTKTVDRGRARLQYKIGVTLAVTNSPRHTTSNTSLGLEASCTMTTWGYEGHLQVLQGLLAGTDYHVVHLKDPRLPIHRDVKALIVHFLVTDASQHVHTCLPWT